MENNKALPDFFINMLKEQYDEENVNEILKGYNVDKFVSFRVNTIKSNVEDILIELRKEMIDFEKVPWSEDAFIIKNAREKEIQQLDIYEEGKIYLQSLSSMLPPIILNPKPNKDILDMTAAPGGKTTQMAALSNNKAHITACEMNPIRAERLKFNVDKQGATCVYTMVKDSRNIDKFFSFDQILLDAPCSGSGTININDKNLKDTFTKHLIEKSIKTQLTLLRKAVEILKPGCEMVYSTCSILACENEDIIEKVVDGKKCEIVPIEFDGINTIPRLPTKIEGTLCVAPNDLYEGFFVAKVKRNF